jgi:hypothetical protein
MFVDESATTIETKLMMMATTKKDGQRAFFSRQKFWIFSVVDHGIPGRFHTQ